MSTINVTVTGNAGADAVQRPGGPTSLWVAVGHRRKVNGEWVDDGTTWVNVAAWDRVGEAAATVRKGDRVIVAGTARLRAYESASGGGVSLDVRADDIGITPRAAGGRAAPDADPWAAGAAGAGDAGGASW